MDKEPLEQEGSNAKPSSERQGRLPVVTLPDEASMNQRLLEVNNQPHFQENFYPILLRYAGQQRNANGVVMMLTLAINDYCQGMPVMQPIMYMQMEQFIDALCPDPEIAKEAKDFYNKVIKGE